MSKSAKPAMQPQHPEPKGAAGAGTYTAKHIIVATGARPRVLPGLEPDGKLVWTYFEAMVPKAMPKSLLVVGSGAIGIEFASFYNAMGVDVTVVEIMDQIMPVEDAEISKIAQKQLEKQGLKIRLGAKVAKLEKGADSVTATIEAGGKSETLTVDRVISAVGVQGNIEGLGLEALGVKTEKGCVVIDGYGRTNVPGVYAIGDVAGPPMLAHKAEHEGVICVEKIKGLDAHPMKKEQIPGCTYCHPQVASVGLTEAKAKAAGFELKIGRFPVPRQWQGHRAGRRPGTGQDHLRCQDGSADRCPHGGRGSDRADPGLRRRHGAGDHRGRADAHGVPASHAVRDDARERARCLWPRHPHVGFVKGRGAVWAAMDQTAAILDAFDMLDLVLAVFGAVVFSLWFGRGKKLGGLLSGAFVGGLAKPAIAMLVGSGLIFAASGGLPEIWQTPEQQQKTLDFWTKGTAKSP